MLVLTRKPLQRIVIGGSIVVTVVRVDGTNVRIGVEAPPEVPVVREELLRGAAHADRGRPPATAAVPGRGRGGRTRASGSTLPTRRSPGPDSPGSLRR
jgi:carbon storage regulator